MQLIVFHLLPILYWTDAILFFEHPAKVKLVAIFAIPTNLGQFAQYRKKMENNELH